MTPPRLLALGLTVLNSVLAPASLVVAAGDATPRTVATVVAVVLLAGLESGLGLLISRARPDNVVGGLLVAQGSAILLVTILSTWDDAVTRSPTALPVWPFVVALEQGAWVVLFLPIAFLLLVFPDGRLLPERRWRVLAVVMSSAALAFWALAGATPGPYPEPYSDVAHPFGTLPAAAAVVVVALPPVLLVCLALVAWSTRSRYRRARRIHRRQLRWLALSGLLLPATLVAGWTSLALFGRPDVLGVPALMCFLVGVPVAVTVAVLRHDALDVDRALAATLSYGFVTMAVVTVFTLGAAAAGTFLGGTSPAVAAATGAACAVGSSPAYRRVRRWVDRHLAPVQAGALDAVDRVTIRVHRGESEPEQVEEALRTALRQPTLRLAYLPAPPGYTDASGERMDPGHQHRLEVTVAGRSIGAILHDDPRDRTVLAPVAERVSLLMEMVLLRARITGALREVEGSRARLLTQTYEERRRLERDLHDGAQHRLVTLGLTLRYAQRHLTDAGFDVDEVLDEAVAELTTSVAELRRIAHGLRPSSLDRGLAAALTALSRSAGLPVHVSLTAEPIPEDVATTLYYVAAEGVTNAAKHSGAGQVEIRVERSPAEATIQITDDGCGGARMGTGSGLAGLADRVAAAGGSLSLASPEGAGTTVKVVLPCAS